MIEDDVRNTYRVLCDHCIWFAARAPIGMYLVPTGIKAKFACTIQAYEYEYCIHDAQWKREEDVDAREGEDAPIVGAGYRLSAL